MHYALFIFAGTATSIQCTCHLKIERSQNLRKSVILYASIRRHWYDKFLQICEYLSFCVQLSDALSIGQ